MICAACGVDCIGPGRDELAEEHCGLCGASICAVCWEADRTCVDVAECQARQADGVMVEHCRRSDGDA